MYDDERGWKTELVHDNKFDARLLSKSRNAE